VLRVKRTSVNATLPVRGTKGAAGYDLAAAQAIVVLAHDKCLVKTGLQIALPPGIYGRIAPRSGLALKKAIDVGAGVVDTDYRDELGVLLFNFSDSDFTVNLGDRIAQLIVEKIKTPLVKELDDLGETDRGGKGFGSTGMSVAEIKDEVAQMNDQARKPKNVTNEANPLAQSRQLITARHIQKLAKADNPVYLAIVRKTDEAPRKRQRSKRITDRVARFAAAHGRTEIHKRSINKMIGPKKDMISVAQREREVISQVPVVYQEKLEEIIQEYRDIFPEQLPKGIPPVRVVEHSINVEPGSKPSYRPPYRLGPAEQDELEEQIRDLLAQGFIQPSCSPYGAPVLFVPKKDGRWRMCVDYRALNKQTIKDRYPLPRIDLLLDRLGQAKVFSKLDLAQGYHQIAMAQDSIEKTAFCTNLGQWEYLVMPFGLCNAPSTFQRLMNEVFKKELNSFILVYLDDILIYSRSIEEHWKHLVHALDKLRRAKLYGRLHKCEFLKDKVDYLGFEVGHDGIRTSPEKVKAILDWPRPQSVHDIRSFIGLASYYRKFMKGFSQLAKPLTDLTRGKVAWSWGDPQENSFKALKVAIATAPILRLPDFERQFVITTDASDVAIGAILEQDFGSGLQPIAFSSRKLNSTEIRYSAYERELLGIVWAIGQWKHYFQGRHPIVIQTDHAPLRHLPNQTSVNSRVWRWLAVLQGYDVDIRHIPGKKNPADSLSRQQVADALVRKTSVTDANASYVQKLRVAEDATHEEIQEALHQLFKHGPQGPIVTRPQAQGQDPQDPSSSEQTRQECPQGKTINASILASTAISKIQLDDELKNSLTSALRSEVPYSELFALLEGGTKQVTRNEYTYKILNSLLMIHDQKQDVNLDFWRIIVLDDGELKRRIIQELHGTPYSAHPGIQ
ncbi:MAG: dUTP diphosphatase, partial [Cohaesibacter sp.]|nr:dUTP diphosphatase [Cohaesibacter sp.]